MSEEEALKVDKTKRKVDMQEEYYVSSKDDKHSLHVSTNKIFTETSTAWSSKRLGAG